MDENSDLGTTTKPSLTDSDSAAAIENPNSNAPAAASEGGSGDDERGEGTGRSRERARFSSLSQVDADLALARTLQEQERAFMMLRMNGDGSDYGSWEGGSYYHDDELDGGDLDDDDEYDEFKDDDDNDELENDDAVEPLNDDTVEHAHHDHGDEDDEDEEDDDNDDEDAFDVHAHADSIEGDVEAVVIDPADFPDDEAYARALQDAEERELAARLWAMAGIAEREVLDIDDHAGESQDAWEEVDPDELSYEELVALGEVVGTESRGLSADTLASLPSINYKSEQTMNGQTDSCVICRLDYEEGETLTVLSCKHSYHSECIVNWLKINKAAFTAHAGLDSSQQYR
ncbi:E3 ubiquitin ligase BIG BROTHER-related-like protein [Drosera capensis]